MASDLSSVCTEANEILDDEKEEGEISLEDVSSSEDVPPYRYQTKLFGQCPHCLSTGHCATWCRSLTLDKKIFVRASQKKPLGKVQLYVGAQVAYVITEDAGKENRRHHHHHHRHGHNQRAAVPPAGLLGEDFQPISSDDDMELVGLAKKKKARKKKRRRKSLSLSLSPSPVNMAIKESIHRGPPRRHQSPVRRKPQQQQLHKSHKSPPPRKLSPQRMKKLKKPIGGDSPLQSRGTVTKLLKKVKKLEPFSTRSKEKRSSLKDKLSNIIGGKKSDEEEIVTVQLKSKSPEIEKREVAKSQPESVDERKKQQVITEEEKKKQLNDEEKKKESDEDLRQVTITTKPESTTKESAEVSQPTPPVKEEERPPEPDEDLQLRVIALRSAVMKKHRTRIARAKKQQLMQQKEQESVNEPIPRIESPFTSSFNEDFPLLAEICSPSSPLDANKDDIYCPEDMELDSDMELDKEVAMVLSGAEEDMNNIVDNDSPYSPTDDLGSPKVTTDQPMDLSMYIPSKPTEIPMHVPNNMVRKNDTLDGNILESRPYSPSDATIYDPELPGVLCANTSVSMPLQPSPLPPLGVMPMMPINPMNLLTTCPIMPMSGFAPVNPMLTAPFIPFTATPTTTVAPPSNTVSQLIEEFETDLDGSPLVPIEPKDTPIWKFIGEPLYLPDVNHLSVPGLVPSPVLKCNKQLQKTLPIKPPIESLFRNAEMRPVMLEDENKISGAMFKPIKLTTHVKKAVTTQPAAAFDASVEESVDNQKQIWPELEQDLRELEELEEQENRRRQELEEKKKQERREAEERQKQEQREAEEKRRREEKEEAERRRKREREEAERRRRIRETPIRRIRKKSVTPAPSVRRRNARSPSRARDIYRYKSSRSSRDSESRSKSKKTENGKEKPEERERKISIDDDEQALREILLASLAKRKPNAKRKAALEAAKRKAALEATIATSDKENIAEKPAETTALEKSTTVNSPQSISTANNIAIPLTDSSIVLSPAILQQQQSPLKRPPSELSPLEQPPRKVVRKLNVIPASTRVVNNAIRYQNLIIQRKLFNQQKQALYKTRFAVINGQNSKSPPIIQTPSVAQRFVISLNEDTESEPEADDKKDKPTKNRPLLAIPTTDFEQSVDQFLKGMRLQQECLATTTSVAVSKTATPPIVAKANSSVTSKTVTTTTTPAVTDATTITAMVDKDAVTTAAVVTATTTTTTVVAAAATAAVATATAAATIAVPKVVTTTLTISSPRERTVLNIPKLKTTANILKIPITPQVVKHLPKSQQEEYRRLKQQIYQYEQQRLQKTKESATVIAATTIQAQSPTIKPINTLSSPSTPSSSPLVFASSTPKTSVGKPMPKTQLIATISPMAKPSNVTPAGVTSTKIIDTTSNVITKTTTPTINPVSKITSSSSTTESSSSKPVVTSAAKVTLPDPSQLKLLSKITESLNSTKTLLNTAASKISSISSKSLKVLTKEQINQKTSQIQQKNNCVVVMDDLNKTGENIVVAEKKEIDEKETTTEEKEATNKMEKTDATKESDKKVSLVDVKSKDEDKSKQTWDDFRQVVSNEVQTLSNLATEEQKKLLTETEEKLICKRHAVLEDITVMSGSLRQWEIERDKTNIISAEIVSLREQLRIAEEKLQGQKVKLQKIQPKVTLYHEKINTGRKECFRLSKICNGLGQQIVGSDYKVPTAGAELLNNRIKEVATHTQKLRGKAVSVQSNNAAKTGRSLKSNSKANNDPNSTIEKLNKKQNNKAEPKFDGADFIRFSDVSDGTNITSTDGGACAAISMVATIRKSKNNFNKHNSKKPMDTINGNSFIKLASTRKSQSTNVNINRYKRIGRKQFSKRKKIPEKVQKSQPKVATATTLNNATTSSLEISQQSDFNVKNKISNNVMGTNKNSNSMKVTTGQSTFKNEINSNKPEILKARSNVEAGVKINGKDNNSSKTPSIAKLDESLDNMSNETAVNTTNQLLDAASVVDKANRNETVIEKLSEVQVRQSADVTENSIETDCQKQLEEASENATDITAKSNVATESENIVNGISSNSNNAINDTPDKMENEVTNVNTTDETRTDEQSVNSGPTIVITDNCESDSVNNNTNSVVNTSFDDYMKEMTVTGDEFDNMCSKDYKSSASVASNEHSTTFDEEIRLLELASESDVTHEITSECQSIIAVETSDNCQSNAKVEERVDDDKQSVVKAQETIDDCRFITKAERDAINSKPCIVRTEHHMTDSTANQDRQKTISNKAYRPYDSILKLVRAPRNDKTDGILCPFALMGTCIDHECRFIHQPTSHCR